MQLRCPDCCSEEATLIDRSRRLECGNCGAGFTREEALITIADAEAELPPRRRLKSCSSSTRNGLRRS
ncbi:MAG TPA: hypothetical protein VNY83_01390 [Solirubrobacterales bacterium]|nr:hypothetical protein [Solirubrobacterales bacterium]